MRRHRWPEFDCGAESRFNDAATIAFVFSGDLIAAFVAEVFCHFSVRVGNSEEDEQGVRRADTSVSVGYGFGLGGRRYLRAGYRHRRSTAYASRKFFVGI
jgi:hypothetical protein